MQVFSSDLLFYLSAYCDWRSLLNFRRTCARFYKLFDDQFWRRKIEHNFGPIPVNCLPPIYTYLVLRRTSLNKVRISLLRNDSQKERIDSLEQEITILKGSVFRYLRKTYPGRFEVRFTHQKQNYLVGMVREAKRLNAQKGNLIINYDAELDLYGPIGIFLTQDSVAFAPNRVEAPRALQSFLKIFLLEMSSYFELYVIDLRFFNRPVKFPLPPTQRATISSIDDLDYSSLPDRIIDYRPSPFANCQ